MLKSGPIDLVEVLVATGPLSSTEATQPLLAGRDTNYVGWCRVPPNLKAQLEGVDQQHM